MMTKKGDQNLALGLFGWVSRTCYDRATAKRIYELIKLGIMAATHITIVKYCRYKISRSNEKNPGTLP